MAERKADLRRSVHAPAEISRVGPIVESIIRKAVLRVESRELRKIVELMNRSGERYIVLVGSEVASGTGVCKFRSCRGAVRRSDINHAHQRIGAIKHAIAASQNLNTLNAAC